MSSGGHPSAPFTGPSRPINVFENASGVSMNNPEFTIIGGDLINNPTTNTPTHPDPRMQLLLSHCALDALLNSRERSDPPHCSPDTREALLQDIIDWIQSPIQSARVKWLRGSAGSGKTAIAQSVAEMAKELMLPTTCFFFSRTAGSATRIDGHRLFPTIIHQLCVLFPEHRESVIAAIDQDSTLLSQTLQSQANKLLTDPLQQFSFRRWLRALFHRRTLPLLIVIDGLDECRDPKVQCEILQTIANAASALQHFPVRFLIASRPEAHITREFGQYEGFQNLDIPMINLDDDLDASRSIQTFLLQQFQLIRQRHPVGELLGPCWPGDPIMELLITKSSPQFILASTAMKFISTMTAHPQEQLEKVIHLFNMQSPASQDRPLETLDNLYTLIFRGIKEVYWEAIQAFLGIIHLSSFAEYKLESPTAHFLEHLLALRPGDVRLWLEPLASVLDIPNGNDKPIKSLHASLFDFLLNPMRSQDLQLQLCHAQAALVGYYLLKDSGTSEQLASKPSVALSSMFSKSLQGSILLLLSSIKIFDGFSVLKTVLSQCDICFEWLIKYNVDLPLDQMIRLNLHYGSATARIIKDATYLAKHYIYQHIWSHQVDRILLNNFEEVYIILKEHEVAALHMIICTLEDLTKYKSIILLDWPYKNCALPDDLLAKKSEEVQALVGICYELIFTQVYSSNNESKPFSIQKLQYSAGFCVKLWLYLFDPDSPRLKRSSI